MLKETILSPGNYAVVHEKKDDDITSFHTKIKELITRTRRCYRKYSYPFL